MLKKFLMIICAALLVTGCGSGDSSSDKKLSVMLGSNVVSLDSAKCTDSASFELITDCIDGLMQLDADGKAIPAIAESFTVSPDGKTYTFHLRDAKWSNGDPVTADDFVFAWRRHCQKSDKYAYIMGDTVACVKNADAVTKGADPKTLGVNAPDPKTFVVELDAPVPFFPALMSFPTFFPINEKFYNSLDADTYGTTPETFLSNGAFVLSEYLPGSANIQLKKNDSYWNAERVTLDSWQYQVVTSSDNALTAFKNGTLNVVSIGGSQIESVQKDPELLKNLQSIPSGELSYISFNQDPKNNHGGALANVNMRLAISNAIDRESLAENFIANGAKATYTAIPIHFAPNANTGKYFAEDQKQFADYVSFNVEKARAWLDKAKSELGKDSFEFEFIYANDAGNTTVKVAQAIKSQVEENLPGVVIKLQPMPKAEYFDRLTSNSFDIAISSWVPDYDDPMTFFSLWTTAGSEICEHWSNAEYDKIIADCTTGNLAADYDARWTAMYDAEKILLENAVITPLYTSANSMLISPNVSGIEFHVAGVNRVFKYVSVK